MERVDLNTWPRREQYRFFSSLSQPFYSVTFTQDVTGLYRYVKEHRLSFYYALVYLSTQAVNRVDAFHYAVAEGELVRLEERDPSFTDLKPGSDTFHIVTMPCRGTLAEFCAEARRRSRAQEVFLCTQAQSPALIYFSCLPWVELTGLTNERDMQPDDAVPRIAWGKYRRQPDGRVTLGMSVELNHRFADGLHVGRFAQELTRLIEEL